MKSCITCGMPFEGNHANDIGVELPEGPVCTYDSEQGKVKTGEAIFHGGIEFFASAVTNGDRVLAERLTRKNMNNLPYWKKHPFGLLKGKQTSDPEFYAAMAKF